MVNIEVLIKEKKKKKMTLQEISEKSGIPKRTVDDIFSGHTKNPRLDTVQAIERALGLEAPAWTEDDYAEGVRKTKNVTVTAEEEELLSLYKEIGQKKGAGAKALARKILEQVLNN